MRMNQLSHHNSPERQGRGYADSVSHANNHSPKVRHVACVSPRCSTAIHVGRSTAKIIAVLMSHLQPCRETLTLRHAWLNLWDKHIITGRINQVHCGLCKAAPTADAQCVHAQRERERERKDRRRKEEERGRRTTRGERERKDMKTCVLLPPVHVAGVRRPASRRQEGGERKPRPATRKRGEEEEGGRERKSEEAPDPSQNDPSEKPRGVLYPKPCQSTTP